MKIKTQDLAGAALDWAVAKCEGIEVVAWYTKDRDAHFVVLEEAFEDKEPTTFYGDPDDTYYPSFYWAQGGPIIEREKIELVPSIGGNLWYAESLDRHIRAERCPTPLIAAMRCYVASKLGDEVEIPDELC